MTVSSTTRRKTFAGDDVTVSFGTSPMVFFDSSDLVLYVTDDDTGESETLVENTDYTVTGGDGSTGTVSTSGLYGAVASGFTLVIVRDVPDTQDFDPENNDGSDADALEQALDRRVFVTQQLTDQMERSVRLADSDVSGADVTLPTPEAGKWLRWNDDGDGLVNAADSELTDTIIPSAFMETLLDDANAAAARVTLGVSLDTLMSKGDDIASAATINLTNATGDEVTITGSTTIASALLTTGDFRTLLFNETLTLTHGVNLQLPNGGADITTVSGDFAMLRGNSIGRGAFASYQRVSGRPLQQDRPLVRSGTVTAAATASIPITVADLEGAVPWAAGKIIVQVDGLVTSDDSVGVDLRTSTDGGSTFDSGASDYEWTRLAAANGAVTDTSDEADSEISMAVTVGNAANEDVSITIEITEPARTDCPKQITWKAAYRTATPTRGIVTGSGMRIADTDIDSIQLLPTAGTFSFRYRVFAERAS